MVSTCKPGLQWINRVSFISPRCIDLPLMVTRLCSRLTRRASHIPWGVSITHRMIRCFVYTHAGCDGRSSVYKVINITGRDVGNERTCRASDVVIKHKQATVLIASLWSWDNIINCRSLANAESSMLSVLQRCSATRTLTRGVFRGGPNRRAPPLNAAVRVRHS